MPVSRRTVAVGTVLLLVVLAGCQGAGDGGAATTTLPDAGGEPTESASGSPGDSGESGGADGGDAPAVPRVQSRELVRTGTVDLRVAAFGTARERLRALARDTGGFVSDTTQRTHSDRVSENTTVRWTSGEFVLRVPAENFSTAFRRAKALGEVRTATSETRDVTDRLVDLEARLANLRAQRDRLRDLYRRANETEAILDVGDRLSSVQADIEVLAAEREALRRQVALSTLTVEVSERPPDDRGQSDADRPFHEVGLVAAFLDSVDGARVALRSVAVLGAYLLPYVAVFVVPVAAVGYAWRRRRGGDDRSDTGDGEGDDE
jgi:hypothetical protein